MTTAASIDADRLAGALAAWLPGRRWFAGKGRQPRRVEILRAVELVDELDRGGPRGVLAIVAVHFADGTDRYQMPIGLRRELPARLAPALIAEVDGVSVYDATADHELNSVLLGFIARGQDRHEVRFGLEPRGEHAFVVRRGMPNRLMGVEQSNTSIVFGDRYVLKLFRRLVLGINPDLELHRALNQAGSTQIAPLLGTVEAEHSGAPVTLGVLHSFAAEAVDGWQLAQDDLLAVLAGADSGFPAECHRLGAAVAAVHADLARTLGSTRMHSSDTRVLRDRLFARLDAAVRVAPVLRPLSGRLRTVLGAVATLPPGQIVHRVHGDLHLGQVLRTPTRWLLIDFEGEPGARLSERVAPDSPLRDVAGMLRSLDYAAAHRSWSDGGPRPAAATRWAGRARTAFLRGYAVAADVDLRASAALLTAYELDKAVYEVAYETRNRPDRVGVPLSAVRRLAGIEESEDR